jgi:hypothetical protein
MSDDRDFLIDLPPEAGTIDTVYIWIGVHRDGREGMISADMPAAFGATRHMPLITSRRASAEAMAPLAERIRRESTHKTNRIVRVELRTFSRRGDT